MSHPSNYARRAAVTLAAAATALVLGGCAGPNPRDPYEGFNRAMFSFNDTVDKVALKPVATAYKNVLPSFVQTGIDNFFGNLSDAWSVVNDALQGKGTQGARDLGRVGLNTTFGLLGFIDVATPNGLRKHTEDFGQTLGYWGVSSGPYLMLPLLGPSTVRDTAALPVDIAGDIWHYKSPVYIRNIGTVTRVIDQRANLLDASNLLEEAALDRYEFVRDGYLQRRESQVHDGEPEQKQKKPMDTPDDGAKPATAPGATAEAEPVAPAVAEVAPAAPAAVADVASTAAATVVTPETSPIVSSEAAPKELNSGTPAANNVSL
ncbi:VacJ family lipoprotein [Rugamonas sp.]|uniref:MlaA family lipoprotein n=1 Tax=Rugamonas sp. TaxID=1926287 RepID=UPI0025DCCBDD|nr:VacJ family lipoprotein [Rugamonas sp.]